VKVGGYTIKNNVSSDRCETEGIILSLEIVIRLIAEGHGQDVDVENLRAQAFASMPASYTRSTMLILILITTTNFDFQFLEFLL